MNCPKCGFNTDLVRTFQLSEQGPFPERGRFTKDPEHRHTLQFYAWFLSSLSRSRVLDLGSGPGTVAVPLCWLADVAEVVCFDVDETVRKALLETKGEKGLAKLVINGEQGQPHALPFDSDHFDAVVCRYSMHHFPAPIRKV
jgi:SAM-dependent methyltransferase